MARTLASVKRRVRRDQQERTDARVEALRVEYGQASQAIARKGWKRVSPPPDQDHGSSSSESVRSNQERKGKGVIDRLGFPTVEETQKNPPFLKWPSAKEVIVGPASGLPHPTPDPRYIFVEERTPRVVVESATWTGVAVSSGVFEWSRVDRYGHQEWLVAKELADGEWNLQKSVAKRR